jgi:hypothetical protein
MKRFTALLLTHGLSAMFGVLICLFYFNWSSFLPSNFNYRENGVGWFSFGPGVISSSNCLAIEICLGDRSNRIRITDPVKIAAVKKWILDNKFDRQWNYSPKWPQDVGRQVVSTYYIWLSGSTTIDPEKELDSAIVFIPLEALPTGMNETDRDAKIGELKKLIGAD